jgi:hypothetical protein
MTINFKYTFFVVSWGVLEFGCTCILIYLMYEYLEKQIFYNRKHSFYIYLLQ